MVKQNPSDLEQERRRNLEDLIRQARWEAEMVKKLGPEWFEMRDEWLHRALEADRETWKNPKVREALIKAITSKPKEEPGNVKQTITRGSH